MTKQITENSIRIEVSEQHDNPSNCVTFFNPVMQINREFVLACLGSYCDERQGETKCLDAFGATGIAGLQWKKHVKFPVSITVNDVNDECVKNIKSNCEKNCIKFSDNVTMKLTAGDGDSTVPDADCAVIVSQEDANVLMHGTQFNFIHLDPFGSAVQYLDALFRNVFHRGMAVITATDVASLYGKCPQVTKRNYAAYTVRTDYTKEMAVRILLAEAARAASKCNKGFDVLYSVAVEHFVQVGLKIKRGANHANQCVSQISSFMHCLHCQDWGRLPDTNSPVDEPYSHLPCNCNSQHPGHTAVIVGPMWNGEIYNTDFVSQMYHKAVEYNLSKRAQELMKSMVIESQCLDEEPQLAIFDKENEKKNTGNTDSGNEQNVKVSEQSVDYESVTESMQSDNGDVKGKKATQNLDNKDSSQEKRPIEEPLNSDNCKKMKKTLRNYSEKEMPLFYYSLHKRRFKAVDVPKIGKLIAKMHIEGYRATKTSFDTHGLRTNATLTELTQVLQKYYTQKR